ncbi:flagellar protein FliT [Evansella vedderi]|uniref:Flagellar protein FliT n=1 Tax=Evansella vedderi TaxID=38282 RepID=A0ABT9ZTL3_9BACI|nr:hypothetical protein [Evansella vedderi]MDQ0254539.1 flagellar protein FliT [Evansella vedderi]
MSSFKKLYDITEQLFKLVGSSSNKEEREIYIEKLTSLVDEREIVLSSLNGVEPSETDKELLKKAVEWNQQMAPKLQQELNMIKRDMLQLKQKKETGRRYENPYAHDPVDGAFIDKKN